HEGKIFFYAELNTEIENLEKKNENTKEGFAIAHLKDGNNKPVEMKIGLSFVSAEGAKLNLQKEIGTQSFQQVHAAGKKTWEDLLSTIQVKGGTEKELELFYTSLYRTFLWPALRSDVDGGYIDEKGKPGQLDYNYYTTPSLWDTYRNRDIM